MTNIVTSVFKVQIQCFMQITIEFDAPQFSDNWNYKLLAKLAFIKQITMGEQLIVNNVEPIETKEE